VPVELILLCVAVTLHNRWHAEMSRFRFFKSKSSPTISFQNPIQIWQIDNIKVQILFKSEILSIMFF